MVSCFAENSDSLVGRGQGVGSDAADNISQMICDMKQNIKIGTHCAQIRNKKTFVVIIVIQTVEFRVTFVCVLRI